ncbi:MAG: TIGR03560 family F420-dependent LLM class oxidoreductase [Anaerolineae bacterium]|nr:TIGR03560 family F420-dependent LLM class oxidoreductase [Anaerolineae bacterium]
MLEVALMIEGQMGLNWDRWKRIAIQTEELGFAGLYRSDHYTNPNPPDDDSLELWVSLVWLASHTERIEFGPLVTPLSFRDPTMTARMASAVDDLSGGRLQLGLGAGWQEREHESWGWELLNIPERFERFEDGLQIITQLLNSQEAISYEGNYYQVKDALMLPHPARPGGPPIVIGGSGPKYTLPLAAKYSHEWNCLGRSPEVFKELDAQLDELIAKQGREPREVKRSMMVGFEYGEDDHDLNKRIDERFSGKYSVDDLEEYGLVVGSGDRIVDRLGKLAQAGVQRVMLQWLDLDGLDRLEAMASEILPQMK